MLSRNAYWCFALATLAYAQPPCVAPFYAAGSSFNASATPNVAGFLAVAIPLTRCGPSFQAYSFTLHNITPRGSGANLKLLSTTTTGAAIPLQRVGPFNLYAFGNIGVTTDGSGATLAGTYGGLITFPLWNHAKLRGLLAAQKIEGLSVYGIALGRSW